MTDAPKAEPPRPAEPILSFKDPPIPITEIQRLALRPGDLVVLKTEQDIDDGTLDRTLQFLRKALGFEVPLVYLGAQDSLTVWRGEPLSEVTDAPTDSIEDAA